MEYDLGRTTCISSCIGENDYLLLGTSDRVLYLLHQETLALFVEIRVCFLAYPVPFLADNEFTFDNITQNLVHFSWDI